MYTFLVKDNDSLIATSKEQIYHRTSSIHKLRFLVDPIWTKDGLSSDMRTFDCIFEYRTPISHRWTPMHLSPMTELYKDKVDYQVDIDINMTAEVGTLEFKLTWAKLDMVNGQMKSRVRKTPETGIEILPTAMWSDYIAESDLDILVQGTLQNQAYMNQVAEYAEEIKQLAQYNTITKADNIRTEDVDGKQYVQLESMGMPIGDAVEVKGSDCNCDGSGGGGSTGGDEGGFPTVDFDDTTGGGSGDAAEDENQFDVVLF